jgi:hypothetical protein
MKFELEADLDTEAGRDEARRWITKLQCLIHLRERATWFARPAFVGPTMPYVGEDMTQCPDYDGRFDDAR